MIRRPPRSTLSSSSAASDVYKRQVYKVGLIALLGVEGGIPVVDYIATGIIISRGSNFLSDLLTRIKSGGATTTVTTTPISSSTTTTTETTPTDPDTLPLP